MSDFPPVRALTFGNGSVLSAATALLGLTATSMASTAWPAANLAIFVPIRVPVPVTVCKIVIGAGGTAAGNFDVGIYDAQGNKIVSSGATVKGASVEQVIDIADTIIGPGLYYLGMSADGPNNYVMVTPPGGSPAGIQMARLVGTLEMATAYPLPATATLVTRTSAAIPMVALYLRSY